MMAALLGERTPRSTLTEGECSSIEAGTVCESTTMRGLLPFFIFENPGIVVAGSGTFTLYISGW